MGAIEGKELRVAACPLCNAYSSKKLTLLDKHIVEVHGRTTQSVWDDHNGGPVKCACGCGETTRWNGWWKGYSRVVNGHNGSIYAVCRPEEAERISESRKAALRGRPSWAAGRTKESDERIRSRGEATSRGRKAAFDAGKIVSWNKGRTASDDPRVAAAAADLKEKFRTGETIPWAKGLTMETDARVASMAQKVSLSLREENLRRKLDAMKRLPGEEIRKRVESRGLLRVVGGLENYVNDAHRVIEVECSGCGQVFMGSLRSLQYGKCFSCSPGGSAAQEEVARWIESLGVSVKRNDRSTLDGALEIDIFVPERRVGVEYNGLYWHSHVNKSGAYHDNKTKAALRANVALVHVFEDEWRDKRDIVKSIISAKLGLSKTRIGARQCQLKQLSTEERRTFFNDNHLDGDVTATTAWGLTHNDVIVYALSLRRPLHKKAGVVEVARCCPKRDHNVPGGLSRLVKASRTWCAEEGHEKILTYVDTRLGGTGLGYVAAGFREASRTPPRWWWTDFDDRFNRFKYRADSSRGLTEAAVAEKAGVVKIWGCENRVYEMHV